MAYKRVIGAAALLCGLGAATAAEAGGACWDRQTVEAAQIREFDIMLMVSALRCQVKGVDFVADYNRFVVGNRAVLVAASDEIRRHYSGEMGGRAALDAYDHLGTAMANRYGRGGVSDDCAELHAIVVAAMADAGGATRDHLLAGAQRVGMDPALDGGRCPVTVAAAAAEPVVEAVRPPALGPIIAAAMSARPAAPAPARIALAQ